MTRSFRYPLKKARLGLNIFIMSLFNTFGFAVDYYVKPPNLGGSDTQSGLSLAEAFATISKAASLAQAGDRVLVHDGLYRETVAPSNSGAEGGWIIFKPWTAITL